MKRQGGGANQDPASTGSDPMPKSGDQFWHYQGLDQRARMFSVVDGVHFADVADSHGPDNTIAVRRHGHAAAVCRACRGARRATEGRIVPSTIYSWGADILVRSLARMPERRWCRSHRRLRTTIGLTSASISGPFSRSASSAALITVIPGAGLRNDCSAGTAIVWVRATSSGSWTSPSCLICPTPSNLVVGKRKNPASIAALIVSSCTMTCLPVGLRRMIGTISSPE